MTKKIKLNFNGSAFWLIFWTLLFLPVALIIFITGLEYEKSGMTYRLNYEGSDFWLYFWTIVFFPIAAVLAMINGFSIVENPASAASIV